MLMYIPFAAMSFFQLVNFWSQKENRKDIAKNYSANNVQYSSSCSSTENFPWLGETEKRKEIVKAAATKNSREFNIFLRVMGLFLPILMLGVIVIATGSFSITSGLIISGIMLAADSICEGAFNIILKKVIKLNEDIKEDVYQDSRLSIPSFVFGCVKGVYNNVKWFFSETYSWFKEDVLGLRNNQQSVEPNISNSGGVINTSSSGVTMAIGEKGADDQDKQATTADKRVETARLGNNGAQCSFFLGSFWHKDNTIYPYGSYMHRQQAKQWGTQVANIMPVPANHPSTSQRYGMRDMFS